MQGKVFRYWGKAGANYASEPKWHPLVWHGLDVAAVGSVWLGLSPALRAAFNAAFPGTHDDAGPPRAWVLFFLALHDLGKFDLRFQMKALEALALSWPEFDPDPDEVDFYQAKKYKDHGAEGLAWAYLECQAWAGSDRPEVKRAWLPWLKAVTGHHGEWASSIGQPSRPDAPDEYVEHDRLARQQYVKAIAALFLEPHGLALTALPPACSDAALHLLAGFCSVCDWIGSNTDISPYADIAPGATVQAYLAARVRDIAEKNWLHRLGLIQKPHVYQGVAALLHGNETPRGVQTEVDALPLEPGLTLIEAPTGSGKTEAALAHAWRLLAAGHADSIVFALPTQATANAMLTRSMEFAGRAYGADPTNVVLAHGKRNFNQDFDRLLQTGRRKPAQGREEAGIQCAEWLAQSRKRVFLGQIGVCTVDQVLLSVLPVRHKFVRGFGINKSVLIVDEVHAYDTYMVGLLEEVLRRQNAAGGSAILLSATLPSTMRCDLLATWQADSDAVDDYPAIWQAPSHTAGDVPHRLTPITVAESQRPRERKVAIEHLRLPDALPDEALLEKIIAAADAGARVAVILNLVDAAQATARRLREMTGLPVDIFHARYRFIDRREKEAAVLREYGREAARVGGRILVATQVVEQSLDLDFDWMVTQICPADLLFQRMGRLHRHEWRKDRPPGYESPCCTVVSVPGEDYGVLEVIYGNTRVLWRTDQLLAAGGEIVFPEAYRAWIERVYGEDFTPNEPPAITRNFDDWQGKQYAANQDAKAMISTPRLRSFEDDPAITIKTRDGEMSLTVLPLRDDGRLLDGNEINNLEEREQAETLSLNLVPVPASWLNFLHENALKMDESGRFPLSMRAEGVAHVASLKGGKMLRYTSEFGLERVSHESESLR